MWDYDASHFQYYPNPACQCANGYTQRTITNKPGDYLAPTCVWDASCQGDSQDSNGDWDSGEWVVLHAESCITEDACTANAEHH